MKMPLKDWEPMADWACRNGWTESEAYDHSLQHNEIEGNRSWVRWGPSPPNAPKWVKISKSDQ